MTDLILLIAGIPCAIAFALLAFCVIAAFVLMAVPRSDDELKQMSRDAWPD